MVDFGKPFLLVQSESGKGWWKTQGRGKHTVRGRFAQKTRRCSQRKTAGNSKSGSEKGVFWKRGLFRKVNFLEILENLEILEFLENPQTEKERSFRPFSRDSRELRAFRDSRDFSSAKTPFVMTPFSGPDKDRERANRALVIVL